jgi:hypothetical protein
MKSFEQEGRAYTLLIPSFQKLRDEKHLKPLAFPKCFYASVADSLLLLENMKRKNFEVVEKKPERKIFFKLLFYRQPIEKEGWETLQKLITLILIP